MMMMMMIKRQFLNIYIIICYQCYQSYFATCYDTIIRLILLCSCKCKLQNVLRLKCT